MSLSSSGSSVTKDPYPALCPHRDTYNAVINLKTCLKTSVPCKGCHLAQRGQMRSKLIGAGNRLCPGFTRLMPHKTV